MNELDQVKEYLQSLQGRIVAELEQLDGKATFKRDAWQRPGGGGGLSCVLSDGAIFEQAGVGFSHVFGDQLPPSATKARPELSGQAFQAVGVSLVIHPLNPYVPTTHANFRYFAAGDIDSALQQLFPQLVVTDQEVVDYYQQIRSHAVLSVSRGRRALAHGGENIL